ncbi:MAG: hypothetical protein IPK85_04780 [Gemmatimonadetes bacterium]|nr:hypothetical protein [Gemmatimonadota bacterium]
MLLVGWQLWGPIDDDFSQLTGVQLSDARLPVSSLRQAFVSLDSLVEPAERERLRAVLPESLWQYHFSLGLFLRNGFLRESAGREVMQYLRQRGHPHPDDASGIVLDLWSSYLRGQPLDIEGALQRIPPAPLEVPDSASAAASLGREPAEQPRGESDDGAPCIALETDSVRLEGQVIARVYPGRPNYESLAKGDEPDSVIVLRVTRPVCVRHGSADRSVRTNVRELQLFLTREDFLKARSLVGRAVTLSGTIAEAVWGWHHLPFLFHTSLRHAASNVAA